MKLSHCGLTDVGPEGKIPAIQIQKQHIIHEDKELNKYKSLWQNEEKRVGERKVYWGIYNYIVNIFFIKNCHNQKGEDAHENVNLI